MLIDDKKDKGASGGVLPGPGDVPPPYDQPKPSQSSPPPTPPSVPSASRRNSKQLKVPSISPTNFLYISRKNSSIKGTYVIDSGLQIPDELLSPAAPSKSSDGPSANGGPRKNISLECANGSISVDIWLVGGDSADVDRSGQSERRSELYLKGQNGSVTLKLNSTTPDPFVLSATTNNGSVSVAIPLDFVGPVTITTRNGSVSLPGSMGSRLITLSEADGKRNCFIGDFRSLNYTGRASWSGSTLDLGSNNGGVKLSFIDEAETEGSNSNGFWRRILWKPTPVHNT